MHPSVCTNGGRKKQPQVLRSGCSSTTTWTSPSNLSASSLRFRCIGRFSRTTTLGNCAGAIAQCKNSTANLATCCMLCACVCTVARACGVTRWRTSLASGRPTWTRLIQVRNPPSSTKSRALLKDTSTKNIHMVASYHHWRVAQRWLALQHQPECCVCARPTDSQPRALACTMKKRSRSQITGGDGADSSDEEVAKELVAAGLVQASSGVGQYKTVCCVCPTSLRHRRAPTRPGLRISNNV